MLNRNFSDYVDYFSKIIDNYSLFDLKLLYEGRFNHEIIKSILYTLEQSFYKLPYSRIIQKKVFNIMVEIIQNIEKHGITDTNSALSILMYEKQIILLSGNIIPREQKQILIEQKSKLEGKTKHELRSMYKKQLVDGVISHKGGAGLGLIDIARKSNGQHYFYFYKIDEQYEIFIQKICINIK
jgi:hypothetical protein